MLSNKPVEIVGGQGYVEIKPQGVSKGGALERLLASACCAMPADDAADGAASPRPDPASSLASPPPSASSRGRAGPDFMLCIGDDRSDEDMYTSIETMKSSLTMTVEVRPGGRACGALEGEEGCRWGC